MHFKGQLGQVLIWLIVIAFAFNLIICLYSSMAHLCLLYQRKNKKINPSLVSQKLKSAVVGKISNIYSMRKS